MKIIIMGPPGAGKGTQASFIVKRYNIPHIATGDMFREAIKNKTDLGKLAYSYIEKGELVPDEVTIALVKERLSQEDVQKGFLLDGFPRNIEQKISLDKILVELNHDIDVVLNIDVAEEKIIERIIYRRVCSICGKTYHLKYNPPKVEGKCDIDGGDLYQRKDDVEETIKTRLHVYNEQTLSIYQAYSEQDLIVDVDGDRDINEVTSEIESILGELN